MPRETMEKLRGGTMSAVLESRSLAGVESDAGSVERSIGLAELDAATGRGAAVLTALLTAAPSLRSASVADCKVPTAASWSLVPDAARLTPSCFASGSTWLDFVLDVLGDGSTVAAVACCVAVAHGGA